MQNEAWLVHRALFTQHWIIERKSWARSLGWVDDLKETALSHGWAQYGGKELTITEYADIVDAPNSEKKLYHFKDGKWDHISGPALFVVKKNDQESFIAGWGGDPKVIEKLKKKSTNPWEWKGITIVEVDASCAVPTVRTSIPKRVLPVFFVSNGESNADENWNRVKSLCPRAVRIDGIMGRRNVFRKCAELANDTHFIKVTGKNYVTDPSIFDFYPDSSMQDCHIVFRAKNTSNGIESGHMAIVCYNTKLVLDTPPSFGLDFTAYSKIYSIPQTVSEANFAETPYEAWRTAFRETVKLTLRDDGVSRELLNVWLSRAQGPNSEWVLRGAKDGYEFACKNKNDMTTLERSVDWMWLENYFREVLPTHK